MIPGFNTDIEFNGTVYHVQTEDKGLQKRMIMSLVYDRGTILASKRATYDDLSSVNFSESELTERLARQHKLICAAVRAGRIDELKDMTAKSAIPKVKAEVVVPAMPPASPPIRTDYAASKAPLKIALVETDRVSPPPVVNAPTSTAIRPGPRPPEPIIEAVEIVEDVPILPPEAVAVVSELSGRERTQNNKLSLEMLGETKFKGGDRRSVNLMICRGTQRKVVADAQIMIKVIGSSFRPVIFHAKSDLNGLAKVHLQLPRFSAGRAALLVRVISDGEEIELRRAVTPG